LPYFIKSNSPISTYPRECPFCRLREATTKFRQTFAKMRLSKIPGRVVSETIKPLLPGCENCSSWFRTTRILMFIFGMLALLGPIWAFVAIEMWGNGKLTTGLWVSTIIVWAILFLLRKWRGNSFKIVYFSNGEFIYAGKEEKYISDLARINKLSYEKKHFVVRLT
jgi:hypothetical protein